MLLTLEFPHSHSVCTATTLIDINPHLSLICSQILFFNEAPSFCLSWGSRLFKGTSWDFIHQKNKYPKAKRETNMNGDQWHRRQAWASPRDHLQPLVVNCETVLLYCKAWGQCIAFQQQHQMGGSQHCSGCLPTHLLTADTFSQP